MATVVLKVNINKSLRHVASEEHPILTDVSIGKLSLIGKTNALCKCGSKFEIVSKSAVT